MKKKSAFSFEETLVELETLVNQLEQGQLGLDESVKLFEQGMEKSKKCQLALKSAEQKIEVLMQGDSKDTYQDYNQMPENSEDTDDSSS